VRSVASVASTWCQKRRSVLGAAATQKPPPAETRPVGACATLRAPVRCTRSGRVPALCHQCRDTSGCASMSSFPVCRAHATMSAGAPGSVAITLNTWPMAIFLIALEVRITGSGQSKPLQSRTWSSCSASVMPSVPLIAPYPGTVLHKPHSQDSLRYPHHSTQGFPGQAPSPGCQRHGPCTCVRLR